MKTALVTGCLGQDGTYLTEYLLALGYRVVGFIRRTPWSSRPAVQWALKQAWTERVEFVYGDVRDEASLRSAIKKSWPDEIYNLAGQVYVPISWEQAEHTFDVNVGGLARILRIVEQVKKDTKVYQASSSEMYGNHEGACNAETPMFPTSPYGVSKFAAHRLVGLYRTRGLYVVAGILFNHECVAGHMPVVIKKHGLLDVMAIEELVCRNSRGKAVQTWDFEGKGVQVWDGLDWTDLQAVTATSRKKRQREHDILSVQARGGSVEVTRHHRMVNHDGEELMAGDVKVRMRLKMAESWPGILNSTCLTEEFSELLGLLVSEGSGGPGSLRFTNCDRNLINRVKVLWKKTCAGWVTSPKEIYPQPSSEFYNEKNPRPTLGIGLVSNSLLRHWIVSQIYTRRGFKKVPQLVLNSSEKMIRAFLKGYYAGDGLKAGKGDSVKTNSATLAQGLLLLYKMLGRDSSVYVEHRNRHVYYQLNISGAKHPGKGQHLRKDCAEVRRVLKVANVFETAHRVEDRDWVYDLETESGLFCVGVGKLVVHNSPRRGHEMVTRKIARVVAGWAGGSEDTLFLGNMDSRRDWGFAGEYVKAMHKMLQQEEPGDYVVGTGVSHSVMDFLLTACEVTGVSQEFAMEHLKVDERLKRMQEIYDMSADNAKIREKLGWEPQTSFRELVQCMCQAEVDRLKNVEQVTEEESQSHVDECGVVRAVSD